MNNLLGELRLFEGMSEWVGVSRSWAEKLRDLNLGEPIVWFPPMSHTGPGQEGVETVIIQNRMLRHMGILLTHTHLVATPLGVPTNYEMSATTSFDIHQVTVGGDRADRGTPGIMVRDRQSKESVMWFRLKMNNPGILNAWNRLVRISDVDELHSALFYFKRAIEIIRSHHQA